MPWPKPGKSKLEAQVVSASVWIGRETGGLLRPRGSHLGESRAGLLCGFSKGHKTKALLVVFLGDKGDFKPRLALYPQTQHLTLAPRLGKHRLS